MTQVSVVDHTVELLTSRYKAAFEEYRVIVDKNAELSLTGGRPSEQSLLEEERAFQDLDVARHALLDAATLAFPTLH